MRGFLKGPFRSQRSLSSLLLLATLCLLAPSPAAADDATDQAVSWALQAAGVDLQPDEVAVVKSVMGCAVNGGHLEDCGRDALTSQLPDEAKPLANCLLQGGDLPTCAQKEIVGQLPASVQPAANCLIRSALNAGSSLGDCVSQAVVGAIPDPTIQKVAKCVLSPQQVTGCAADALAKELGPNAGPVVQCLLNKTAPPAQCLAQAAGPLPPELKCLADQATASTCLEQAVIDRLPPDQQALAKCLTNPAAAQQCAKDKLTQQLPPGVADAVNCIAKAQNPATCAGGVAKGTSLGDALDTLNKMMSNTQTIDPGHAPSSLANLVKIASGIKNGNWGDVIEYGGAEIFKAAAHIVINEVLPEAVPGLGELLKFLAGPILDTMVQDRLDLVNELLGLLKKCSKADHSECNVGKLAQILGEFVMLVQVEVPCSLLSAISDDVRSAICGPVGELIVAIGSAAYDFYQDNDKELAAFAALEIPGVGPLIAGAILAGDPDVQHAISGNPDQCPANYFPSKMAVCLKEQAYLNFTDPGRASHFVLEIESACQSAFYSCSQGLLGSDSDRIAAHCNPGPLGRRTTPPPRRRTIECSPDPVRDL
jgi:hypothetical protein